MKKTTRVREQLRKLTPERFEEFAKELLWLDGFKNITLNAKGPDGGWDLLADKSYQIAHGREHVISWLIQCKHTKGNRALSTSIVKEILYNFETQDDYQGLIIITNAMLPANAINRINDLAKSRNRLIFHWDITDIEKFIDDHPFLVDKFNLDIPSEVIEGAGDISVLILSDGSVFAYNMFNTLRKYGFDVRETRIHQFGSNALSISPLQLVELFDIAIVFLAELYWVPVQKSVLDGIKFSINEGLNVVFTPFCAWSVGSGVNPSLDELLPVSVYEGSVNVFNLLQPDPKTVELNLRFPNYRDTFIENQIISFRVEAGRISSRSFSCNFRNTFEFLVPNPDAQVLMYDSKDNPVLTVNKLGNGKSAYLNICAHNCLTPFPLKSPIENHQSFSRFLADFFLWFGKE